MEAVSLPSTEPSPTPSEQPSPSRHLSWSQLSLFLKCPLKYAFKYIEGMAEPIDGNRLLGQAVHRGVEAYYRLLLGTPFGLPHDAVVSHLDQAVKEGEVHWGESSRVEVERTALNLLETYMDSIKPGEVVASEEAFEVRLEKLPALIGFFDLVELDSENRLVVADLKTGAANWSSLQVDIDLQLSLYAIAAGEIYGIEPSSIRLRIDLLTKTKTPKLAQHWTERSDGQLEWAKSLLTSAWRLIEQGRFHPNPSVLNCAKCPYRSVCSKWRA